MIEVTIVEGKFHQVKRMFKQVGKEVLNLHRIAMGPLELDEDLAIGEWREINEIEYEKLQLYGVE